MNIVKFSDVQDKIISVRGENVLLDSDVAGLYGVETRDINKSVKNNPRKFPDGYIISLTDNEKAEVVENFHHLEKIKFSPVMPKAFTKKGCYMLATVLKGDKAIDTTIAIIEAFDKLIELQETVVELSKAPDEPKQKALMQKGGDIIAELIDNDLQATDSETSIELNFAVFRFKHTVKRQKIN